MNRKQFEDAARLRGTELARWPAPEQDAARQLLGREPALQAWLEEERAFEACISRRPIQEHSPDFTGRIIAAAQRMQQRPIPSFKEWFDRLFAEFWMPRPAFACLAILAAGMLLGFASGGNQVTSSFMETDYVQDFFLDDDGVAL